MTGAIERPARQLGRWELRLDGAIHAVAIVGGIVGAVVLLVMAASRGDFRDVAAVAIYSSGLIAMFCCSAAYNAGRWRRCANLLQGLDHSAIFIMIAGTYTPFTLLRLEGAWSVGLTALVWSVAGFGILLRLLRPRLFDRLSIGLYLALGWIAVVALAPLSQAVSTPILILLAIGGVLYTIGIVFHLWERLPFQNAIWHAFVLAAAGIHYAAVAASIAVAPGAF